MKLTLSNSLSDRIATLAVERGFEDPERYIETLLDEDWRQLAGDALDELLLEGLESGGSIEVTPEFWDEQKRKFIERHPEAAK
jgi:antitoxin ParD1/3/4